MYMCTYNNRKKGDDTMQVQTIAVWDIQEKLKQSQTTLIDLRDKEEYDSEHIEGAIWIPYDQIMEKIKFYDAQKQIILYCDRGNASFIAARELATQGYKVYTVLGGFLAYKRMKQKKIKH